MSSEQYRVVRTQRSELGRFAIRLDSISKDGKIYPYSYVEFKECVGVLPIIDGNICLIKQYRHSLKKELYEIPGGSIDKDESPIEAAIRELREETGFICDETNSLGFYYPSPGASNEKCYLFYALCGEKVKSELEPLELIKSVIVSLSEFEKIILQEKFFHSMGLVAWLRYKLEVNHD